MEQRSSVATKAVAAFAGGRSGHRFGERGEGGRGGCRGPQQAAGEEGEKGIPPLLATVRDEIGRKRSKMCIIISYHIFLLGNDTEMIHSKMIFISETIPSDRTYVDID
jgi:hypothetical protein